MIDTAIFDTYKDMMNTGLRSSLKEDSMGSKEQKKNGGKRFSYIRKMFHKKEDDIKIQKTKKPTTKAPLHEKLVEKKVKKTKEKMEEDLGEEWIFKEKDEGMSYEDKCEE